MLFVENKTYEYEMIAGILSKEILESSYKIVGITGTSSVGKSTFTKMIKEQLEKEGHTVLVINMDDYLKEKFKARHRFWNRLESTYLKPEYFEWKQTKDEIDALQRGESVERECYVRGHGWDNRIVLKPAEYLFVEGLFLDSVQAAECMEYDLMISLTAEDELIRKMRTERDAYYRKNFPNFQRTESETQQEIENTLMAGKSYKVCYDKWKYVKLNVLENYQATVKV